MVWQPAEGGEAVSAAEWSRVVVGDDGAGAGPTAEAGRARSEPSRRARRRPTHRVDRVDRQKPDESVDAAAAEATDGVEPEESTA